MPDFLVGDVIIECKGLLNKTDRAKVKKITRNLPAVSLSGRVFNKFLMVVQCSFSVTADWQNWKGQKLKKVTDNLAGKRLCLWCKQNNISYVPVALDNFIWFEKWLKENGYGKVG